MQAQRKRIRLDKEAYAQPDHTFLITICTAQRRPIFANEAYAQAVFKALREGPLVCEAECLAACLMPDHLHLLLVPRRVNLIPLLDRWKAFTTNLLHAMGLKGPVWQRSFYDHILRADEPATEAAGYIVNNPVRQGLVGEWEAYAYAWTNVTW